MDDQQRFIDENRHLWEQWAAIHEGSEFYDLEGLVRGEQRLRGYEVEEVGDVAGKSLLHLQCHIGTDTVSWARLGATVTGADFSPKALEVAAELARACGVPDARWVESELYRLPEVLHEEFDVVYTSRGAVGWLPNVDRWAGVVARFLKPGGIFYITEGHPFFWVFENEGVTDLQVKYPYFERTEPISFDAQGSYADPDAPLEPGTREHGWSHGMAETVQALIDHGLVIELFTERRELDWAASFCEQGEDGLFRLRSDLEGEIPLMYSLRARKPLS